MNNLPVPPPRPPVPPQRSANAAAAPTEELLRRLIFLRDKLSPEKRMQVIGKLMFHLRDSVYPHMRIMQRADGSLEVTISRPPADAE